MKYHIDNIPFKIGKYKSYTAYEVANIDPEYIINTFNFYPSLPITEQLYQKCIDKKYSYRE